jgi:hypothetical protein
MLILFIRSCPSPCGTKFCYNCGAYTGMCDCGFWQRDRRPAPSAQPMRLPSRVNGVLTRPLQDFAAFQPATRAQPTGLHPRANSCISRPVQHNGGFQSVEQPASSNRRPNARISSIRRAGGARLPCEHQNWDLTS